MENISFKDKNAVTLSIRIDWSELDLFGHVNNVSIFKYIQSSRVNYWERCGLMDMYRRLNIGPMLVSCKCDFKAPLFYPGDIVINATATKIGNSSFVIEHKIFDGDLQLAALAEDVVVIYDFTQKQKTPFPVELKQRIEQLEQRKL